jgi:hypothetical protein
MTMGKRKRREKRGIQEQCAGTPDICLPTPEFMARNALEPVKTDQGSRTIRVRDKRPIDTYHRLYCIDSERGVGEQYRRGITEDQFRSADRVACNYERTFHNLSKPLDGIRVQSSVNVSLYPVESIINAIHIHTRVMRELSRMSQDIVEAICCKEGSLMDYEERHGWRKGYGMIRLREALDELTNAFKAIGKANRDSR